MSSSTTTDIKYDFTPANPDPGDDYDKFRERCLNAMSKAGERGWSLSDHLLGIDEGGALGPAIVAGPGAANRSRRPEEPIFEFRRRSPSNFGLYSSTLYH